MKGNSRHPYRKSQCSSRVLFGTAILAVFFLGLTFLELGPRDESAPARRPVSLRVAHEAFAAKLHSWDAHLQDASSTVSNAVKLAALATQRSAPPRVLVVYTYAHADWRLLNLEYFLRHGLKAQTQEGIPVDYTFVFNGDAPLHVLQRLGLRYELLKRTAAGAVVWGNDGEGGDVPGQPGQPLIGIVLRENQGFDICASKLAIEKGWAPRPGSYTRVILMNASVRGPFMPTYASFTWVDAFLSRLGGADGVRMVGTTINCLSSRRDAATGAFSSLHVQSMVLALDREAVSAMHPILHCYDEMLEAISHGEVGSTQAVLAAGYAVSALQASWGGFAVRKDNLASDEVARRCAAVSDDVGGDPASPGAYMQGNLHPYETVFIKTNRHLDPEALERLTLLHDSFAMKT